MQETAMNGAISTKPQEDPVGELIASASQVLEQGKLGRAVLFLRKAILLRPGEARCHKMLGLAYQRLGRGWQAQQSFATAAALAPAGAETLATPYPSPQARPAGPAPQPGSKTPPHPHLPSDVPAAFTAREPPATPLPELTADQLPAFLEMVSGCLADIAATERLMEEQGAAAEEAIAAIKSARRELTVELYRSRPGGQADRHPLPASTAAPLAEMPAAVRPEYRAIPSFTQTLGPGAVQKGPEITELQKLLQLEGLDVPVSGQFDKRTAQAISKLQQKYKLKGRHGVVGSETRQLLNRLIGKSP